MTPPTHVYNSNCMHRTEGCDDLLEDEINSLLKKIELCVTNSIF